MSDLINKQTGEVISIEDMIKNLDIDNLPTVEESAGKNLPFCNFRDFPEFDGMNIVILGASIEKSRDSSYEQETYAQIAALVYPDGVSPTREEHGCIIGTGSKNIMQRIEVINQTGAKYPVKGKLRNAGRAWFID